MGRLALRPSWAYHDQLWSQRFDRSKSTSIASKSPIPRKQHFLFTNCDCRSSPIGEALANLLCSPSSIFNNLRMAALLHNLQPEGSGPYVKNPASSERGNSFYD